MPRNEIDNSQDILDSRDVIKRRDELAEEIGDAVRANIADEIEEINRALQTDGMGAYVNGMGEAEADELQTKLAELETLDDALSDGNLSPLLGHARGEEHAESLEEWKTLNDFVGEFEGYADSGGESLIRESYFETYAQEFASDVVEGFSKTGSNWPFTCIDWERAARELQQDYSSAEFGGVTYYYRA